MKKGRINQRVLTAEFERGKINGVKQDGKLCRVKFEDSEGWFEAKDLLSLTKVQEAAPELLEALLKLIIQLDNEHLSEFIDEHKELSEEAIKSATT